MNIVKKIFLNLTHSYRVKRSWMAPYVDHPPIPVRRCWGTYSVKNPLELSDAEALNRWLDAAGIK